MAAASVGIGPEGPPVGTRNPHRAVSHVRMDYTLADQVLQGVPVAVPPNVTITVSEDADPDYTGVIGGACNPDGTIILGPNDNVICDIINNDNPTILINKTVINDGAGTAVEDDFTYRITTDPEPVLCERCRWSR